MSQVLLLSLQGLSCNHCVKRVKEALEARADVEQADVSLNYAKIIGTATPDALIETVKNAGYDANIPNTPDVILYLQGLTCQHCVQSTKTALENTEGVTLAEVTREQAKIWGSANNETLINSVEKAGYKASVQENSRPKSEPLTHTTTPPETVAAASVSSPATPSRHIEESDNYTQLIIEGMSCASCVLKVQKALQNAPGVTEARVNLAERSALVMGQVQENDLLSAVQKAGYGAEIVHDEATQRERQQALTQKSVRRYQWQAALALLLGIPMMLWGLFGGSMTLTQESRPYWLGVGLLTLVVMIVAGGHFFINAWRNLKNRSTTMDTLIALGTGAAWLYSISVVIWPAVFPDEARHLYFEASAMIIGLINLGHALEQRARHRSSKALEKLLDLTPPTARVITEQGEKELPLASVTTGMVLRLTTGDRVPVDGEITEGEAWFDEAMLTGEAVPQQKKTGENVHAGTLVQDGSVLFRANAVGSQTTLARIIKMVRQAQSSKPELGHLADKISSVFVPVVILIAIISALIWYFVGPAPQIVYTLIIATTVLIIACPCALGLAIPMSIISGVGRAAELGVLIRDADALQKGSQVDTIVFDKTGTLTEGRPKVAAIHSFNNVTEAEALRLAAALEQGANHPLAQAILEKAAFSELPAVTQFKTLRGLGVSGICEQKSVLLGNSALLNNQGIDTAPLASLLQQQSEQGFTPVLLAVNSKPAALFSLRDALRSDSLDALNRLRQHGYQLVMLTGDNEVTAKVIAKEAGLDNVIAGVLPDGKADAIKQLQQNNHCVAMVGDGINDAPALAQSDVGIAMGEGSDIAIETASMTLMKQSLHGVADALELSKATLGNMKQNLLGAFVYNSLGIPIAAGILYPFTHILLSPVIAGAAMALSSVTVVTNANRLLRFKPGKKK